MLATFARRTESRLRLGNTRTRKMAWASSCAFQMAAVVYSIEKTATTSYATGNSSSREWMSAPTAGPFGFSLTILLGQVNVGSAGVNGSQVKTSHFNHWISNSP
jgi:hypothetical protein